MPSLEDLQVNLVVAVIIGLLSLGWAWGMRRLRQRAVERQYRVHGTYLSYFEDIHDGRSVWVKAPLTVRQKGADVRAGGLDLLKQRNTDTRAQVTAQGSIVGTYGRQNPNDPAKGVVFLEPDPVNTGLYRGMLQEAFDDAERRAVLGAWVGDRLVGCLFVDAEPDLDPSRIELRKSAVQRVGNLGVHQPGAIHALAVSESYRRQGVATALLRAAEERLRRRSCTAAMAIVWRTPTGADDAGIDDEVFTDQPPSGVDWVDAAPAAPGRRQAQHSDLAGRLLRTEGFRMLGRFLDAAPPPPGSCSDCDDACVCEGWTYFKNVSVDRSYAEPVTTKTSTG